MTSSQDYPGPKDGSGLGTTEGQREAGVEGSLRSSISSDAARGPGLSHSLDGPLSSVAEQKGRKHAKRPRKKKGASTPLVGTSRIDGTTLRHKDEARLLAENDPSKTGQKTFATNRSIDPEDEPLAKAGSPLPAEAGSTKGRVVRPENPGLPDSSR